MNLSFRKHFLVAILLSGILCGIISGAFANPLPDGFKVRIELEGLNDSVLYLANYYGDKTYLTDTAYRDRKGHFVFEADTLLPVGIYILAGQGNMKYLEFIMDKNQRFSIEGELKGLPTDIRFDNSPENEDFIGYIKRSISIRKKADSLRGLYSKEGLSSDSAGLIKNQMEALNHSLDDYQQQLIDKNPGSFVSAILLAMQDPPELYKKGASPEAYDTVQAYQYYKKHYFDKLDLADARLLRTPLYHRQLHTFFTKVVYQNPDSIIKEADRIIHLAKGNKETYKYNIWYMTYTFETSKIMGFDKIFVHMIDEYYAKGQAFWADSSVVKTLVKRSNELRNLLIGETAPNMILLDTSGNFTSMYQVKARYLLVLFYEPDCGHCRKEIKELNKWIPGNTLDVKVFAVCADTSIAKWKKFIVKNKLDWIHVNGTRTVTPDYHKLYDIQTTPTFYLLDENKTILAKKLKTNQLIPFIMNYDRMNHHPGKDK